MSREQKTVLLDAREFIPGRFTGIGRVLEGLVDALLESEVVEKVILATYGPDVVPASLRNRGKTKVKSIPSSFLKSEKALSDLTKDGGKLYISPYPKLPLFGCHCSAINIVHDVLDLTHPSYRKRFKVIFDKLRLKLALRKATLTWYDSVWSMEETGKLVGFTGKNPRVRHLGIDERFRAEKGEDEGDILRRYDLRPGYILIVGNGLPHKNLGAILNIADILSRDLVFAGVSRRNQGYWKRLYPKARVRWIAYVEDRDLPALLRGAFCLAQPSTAEGYGYPPLEAMACGVPAVVSNIPVLRETTGGHAFYASPENPNEWFDNLKALEERDTYRRQVEKGLKWVEPLKGRKGWEKHVGDIEELMEKQ